MRMPILKYLYDHIDLIIAGFFGFLIGGFFGLMTMGLMVAASDRDRGEEDDWDAKI